MDTSFQSSGVRIGADSQPPICTKTDLHEADHRAIIALREIVRQRFVDDRCIQRLVDPSLPIGTLQGFS